MVRARLTHELLESLELSMSVPCSDPLSLSGLSKTPSSLPKMSEKSSSSSSSAYLWISTDDGVRRIEVSSSSTDVYVERRSLPAMPNSAFDRGGLFNSDGWNNLGDKALSI